MVGPHCARGEGHLQHASLLEFRIESQPGTPLYVGLYRTLRRCIVSGRLRPGSRLPATRVLSRDLGIGRNTALRAVAQLIDEGYVRAKRGSGLFVLPVLSTRSKHRRALDDAAPRLTLSARGREIAETQVSSFSGPRGMVPFRPGTPALDMFPFETWDRLRRRICRRSLSLMAYGDPAGYAPLRQQIAQYLRLARGMRCSWEQVVITAGAQQAVFLCGLLLMSAREHAAVESPGHVGLKAALTAAGITCSGVPVDSEGLDVSLLTKCVTVPRVVVVSPSNQFPTTALMSARRRMELIETARSKSFWIVEDDYDSEFRFGGAALATLHELEGGSQVIYVGSFSKVLYPGLRLGFLVAPAPLVNAFAAARAAIDRHQSLFDQAVVTAFFEDGYFATHLKRMRAVYQERYEALMCAAGKYLSGAILMRPCRGGLHAIAYLQGKISDTEVSAALRKFGIDCPALSAFGAPRGTPAALVLGFGAYTVEAIEHACKRMSHVFDKLTVNKL